MNILVNDTVTDPRGSCPTPDLSKSYRKWSQPQAWLFTFTHWYLLLNVVLTAIKSFDSRERYSLVNKLMNKDYEWTGLWTFSFLVHCVTCFSVEVQCIARVEDLTPSNTRSSISKTPGLKRELSGRCASVFYMCRNRSRTDDHMSFSSHSLSESAAVSFSIYSLYGWKLDSAVKSKKFWRYWCIFLTIPVSLKGMLSDN